MMKKTEEQVDKLEPFVSTIESWTDHIVGVSSGHNSISGPPYMTRRRKLINYLEEYVIEHNELPKGKHTILFQHQIGKPKTHPGYPGYPGYLGDRGVVDFDEVASVRAKAGINPTRNAIATAAIKREMIKDTFLDLMRSLVEIGDIVEYLETEYHELMPNFSNRASIELETEIQKTFDGFYFNTFLRTQDEIDVTASKLYRAYDLEVLDEEWQNKVIFASIDTSLAYIKDFAGQLSAILKKLRELGDVYDYSLVIKLFVEALSDMGFEEIDNLELRSRLVARLGAPDWSFEMPV